MPSSTSTATKLTPAQFFRIARAAFLRQREAVVAALVISWTAISFGLWLAALGLVLGAVVGFIGIGTLDSHLGIVGSILNNTGGGLLGALVGAVLGAVAGLIVIPAWLIFHPLELLGALVLGALIALAILYWLIRYEETVLRLRGYRQPSRREGAAVYPLIDEAIAHLGVKSKPPFLMSDMQKPAAWSHMGALVLTRGLLGTYEPTEEPPQPDLDNAALVAVIAHELYHWIRHDAIAVNLVTASFAPVVVILNAIQWLREQSRALALFLWLLFWPLWVCSRFVVAPLMGSATRRQEFEADQAAASMGESYRLGLRRALTELSVWEVPRTGWEHVLASTHPPIEQRLERLEIPSTSPKENLEGSFTATDGTRPRKPVTARKPPARKPPTVKKPAAKPKPPEPEPSVPDDADDRWRV